MGWRSWNAYGADIDQGLIQRNIDALTAKNWTVDGQVLLRWPGPSRHRRIIG
jgi:hypothetical protein